MSLLALTLVLTGALIASDTIVDGWAVKMLYAVAMAPLSHMALARKASMLFAALIGGHLLGESDCRLRVFGESAVTAGVVALALG